MTTKPVSEHIKHGIRMGGQNPAEFGVNNHTGEALPRRKPHTHPNRELHLTEMKHWSITRQTMDVSLGDKGLVIFSVQAPTGPIARKMVDDMVGDINHPFLVKMREGNKRS